MYIYEDLEVYKSKKWFENIRYDYDIYIKLDWVFSLNIVNILVL